MVHANGAEVINPARDEAFILARSAALARAWLRNLLRARRMLVCEPRPRRGTALVVGAGPSLDLAAVRSAQAAGASIWTVNTALPALASVGIVPDVCVTRELVDVAEQLRHPHNALIADIGVRPESVPDEAVFVVPRSASLRDVARALAIETVDCGPSAVTMAVALASLSAARVELHGVDCAYAADGATYHQASGFGDRKAVRASSSEVAYFGAGHDAKRAAHDRSGVGGTMSRETVREVPLRLGGFGLATNDLIDQREWLEEHAARHAMGETMFVDASGGARKQGWRDEEVMPPPFGAGIAFCDPLPALAIDAHDRERMRAAILAEANYLGHVAVNVVHTDGDPGAIPPVAAGIARSLCAADMLRMRKAGASHVELLRAQYATFARAADEVALALGVESSCAADYQRAVLLMGTREAQPTSLMSLAVALANLAEAAPYDDRAAYETAADAVANVAQRAVLLGSGAL